MNKNILSMSFDDYLEELKELSKTKRKIYGGDIIGNNIRKFNITPDFIEANALYFREQYDCNYTPENVLTHIDKDLDYFHHSKSLFLP